MRTRRIRLAVVTTAMATVGVLTFQALPAAAAIQNVETQVQVSAPSTVQKRTPVTFSGSLTSANPDCVSNAVITVTKPTPGAWQVMRRQTFTTSTSGSFSYTKKIYFSGTWTFSFEGRTFVDAATGDTIVCQPSTARFDIRATRR